MKERTIRVTIEVTGFFTAKEVEHRARQLVGLYYTIDKITAYELSFRKIAAEVKSLSNSLVRESGGCG